MPKFICQRPITAADGYQEFTVEAESAEEAKELFERGEGELTFTECEVLDLGEYDLDTIHEES